MAKNKLATPVEAVMVAEVEAVLEPQVAETPTTKPHVEAETETEEHKAKLAALEPHQKRVMDEHIALNAKVNDLTSFLNADEQPDSLDATDIELLTKQLDYMRRYLSVLNMRIERF